MSDRLADKVCIVTGGGAGLGEAICRLFGEQGAKVVVMEINGEDAERVAGEINAEGGTALAVQADVADEDDIKRTVAAALEFDGRIDVLVNNAAVGGEPYNYTVVDTPPDVWERCINVNLRGPAMCMKHVVPVMLAQGGGSIVNIGSISSVVGLPMQNIYAMTKGAILQLTRQTAVEFTRKGVRVNCILPGGMHTPMMESELQDPASQEMVEHELALLPIGRYADPREVAYGVLFFASDESSFCTGSALAMDGGFTAQ
jgi:NAD(P)-dependent dehydrogenase (short-subunit alcohol dehydrogenase family)